MPLTQDLGGGWTASVIPEAARTVETTAGTLMFIDVPKERKDIWEKFDSKHFPAWSYRRGEGDEYGASTSTFRIHGADNRTGITREAE